MDPNAKARWGPGPWQSEPDLVEWKDERTGLACRIRRNMALGNLCGYVGVPPSHPYFGWSYDDEIRLAPGDLESSTLEDVGIFDAFIYAMQGGDKHGTIPLSMTLKAHHGVNFAGSLHNDPSGLWFFGFDCGHAWDVLPGFQMTGLFDELPLAGRTYRDIEYVRKEVTALAFQLRQLETRVLLDEGVLKMIGVVR